MTSKAAETADFERDPNQESLSVDDLKKSKAPSKTNKSPTAQKEKRFLLNELRQVKEHLYSKLLLFKSRSAGARNPSQANQIEEGLFELRENCHIEEVLRKEIDHVFIMTQLLNTVVLKGDETYRTMQELAKLTND